MPAKSKSQQRLMGMVHACQKSGKCASEQVKKMAASMKKSDAKDFAETKHKGLPEVKESMPTFREFLIFEIENPRDPIKGPIIRDRVKGIVREPEEDDKQKPSIKRRGQRATRTLRKRYGFRHPKGMQYDEGYKILPPIDTDRYQEREGLEGPFRTRSGKVVYYDPKEGRYYDPDSDFYISNEEYQEMDR